jgi:hypothetical protein
VLIAAGNKVSRKTEVVEALMRKAITEEAIRRREDAIAYKEEKRLEREKALQKSRRQSSEGGALAKAKEGGGLSVDKIMNMNKEKDGNNEKKRSNTPPTRHSSDSRRKLVGSRQSTADTSSSSTLQT